MGAEGGDSGYWGAEEGAVGLLLQRSCRCSGFCAVRLQIELLLRGRVAYSSAAAAV